MTVFSKSRLFPQPAKSEHWYTFRRAEPSWRYGVGRVPPTRVLMPRRRFLTMAGAVTLALASPPGLADAIVELPLPGGPNERPTTRGFPDKGALILQRTRPPLLETPFEV